LAAAVPLALVPAATGTAGAGGAAAAPWAGPGPGEGPEAELGPAAPCAPTPPAGARRWWDPAVRGAGLAALLLVPLAVAADGPEERRVTAALVLAAAISTGSAEWAARWYRHVGRGHLGAAATLAEFRSRMRPVLPVALALHLAVLAVLSFAALAVLTALAPRPGPAHGGGLLHLAAERAGPAQWAAQGVLGLLLVLPVLLARCGRPAAAALGALAGAAGTAAPPAPSAGLLGGGAVALALLLYAWPVLGRPDAHR
ncbi:hypothetical protein ACFC58_20730, partial [Kitasatospora purpeofusca]